MMDEEEGVDVVVDEDEEHRRKRGKLPHPRTASFPLCSILRN